MPTTVLVRPWQRAHVPSRPPENQPPPPVPDPGPRFPAAPPSQTPLRPAAQSVPYNQVPTEPPGPQVRTAGRAWVPAGAAATLPQSAAPAPARPGARASWANLPVPPRIASPTACPGAAWPQQAAAGDPYGWVNYDPPPEAAGTGLQQTNPDGSWVVHPLSVIHPGSTIGDEGPINEAFLSTPVVYLCAGRPYALGSPVVVPDGATLHLNRAAIDREMIQVGEGAEVRD